MSVKKIATLGILLFYGVNAAAICLNRTVITGYIGKDDIILFGEIQTYSGDRYTILNDEVLTEVNGYTGVLHEYDKRGDGLGCSVSWRIASNEAEKGGSKAAATATRDNIRNNLSEFLESICSDYQQISVLKVDRMRVRSQYKYVPPWDWGERIYTYYNKHISLSDTQSAINFCGSSPF